MADAINTFCEHHAMLLAQLKRQQAEIENDLMTLGATLEKIKEVIKRVELLESLKLTLEQKKE